MSRDLLTKSFGIFGNFIQIKPDSHLSWTLPSVENSSVSFKNFFKYCL